MSKADNYNGVLLEKMDDNIKVVLEVVSQMQVSMKTLATKDELKAVADDVKVIKSALTATNKDLALHDVRIAALEQAA